VNRSAKGSLAELHTVAVQGAAGMICGRAYDDHGISIASDLDTRILAISFVDFCALPSLCVIGIGQSKGRRSSGQLSLEADRTVTASRPVMKSHYLPHWSELSTAGIGHPGAALLYPVRRNAGGVSSLDQSPVRSPQHTSCAIAPVPPRGHGDSSNRFCRARIQLRQFLHQLGMGYLTDDRLERIIVTFLRS
jgi:hypothetical protein